MYGKMQESGFVKIISVIWPQLSGAYNPMFSIPNFVNARYREWLMLEDCNHWLNFAGPSFMVRNLTNIWETFCNQILSHGAGRLIPGQVEIFDMPLQVLNFRLGPINKDWIFWLWSRRHFLLLLLPVPIIITILCYKCDVFP